MQDAGCEMGVQTLLYARAGQTLGPPSWGPDLPRGAARQADPVWEAHTGRGVLSEREAPEFVLKRRTGAEQTRKRFIRFSAV